METRAHHVMIGLFSVIVVVGAMLFGLWLAKSSVDSAFQDYEVVFNEAVSGLSQGSSVQYSGIKVGDVISLRLDPKDPRRVLARIRLTGQTPDQGRHPSQTGADRDYRHLDHPAQRRHPAKPGTQGQGR